MTAASGGIKPPPEYFPTLREICDRHGILMIADEVICGFGRTGRWFGIEHWDVVPDLMAVSKGITSGYIPMGAVLMRPHVAANFDDEWFPLGSTQTGNPIACAAACAALDAYENDGLIENAARMGEVLAEALEDIKAHHPCISDVRSLGLLGAIELTADPETDAPFSTAPNHGAINDLIKRRLIEHGLEAADLSQRHPHRPAALHRRGADPGRHRDPRRDPGRGRRRPRLRPRGSIPDGPRGDASTDTACTVAARRGRPLRAFRLQRSKQGDSTNSSCRQSLMFSPHI